jgi:Aspartyl protease
VISAVGRMWRHVLAPTLFTVSALILVSSIAVAGPKDLVPPLASSSLVSAGMASPAANKPLAAPGANLPSAALDPAAPGANPLASPPGVTVPTQAVTPDTPAVGAPGAVAEVPSQEEISEVVIEAPEPRFAAPTLRDRIGRIWAPVLINGRGPYRLVLDTGATHSAIISHVVTSLGIPLSTLASVRVTGVTGSAIVPTVDVSKMQVGELWMDAATLPVVADVFGGAEGVLGTEGLSDKRIVIDFGRDKVTIIRSKGDIGRAGFATLPLRQLRDRLLALDVMVGGVRAKAIIDTGAQVSIGNNALRTALMHHYSKDSHKAEIEGVTLEVETGDMMRAPPIAVGPLTFNYVNITYGDMFIFDRWKLNHEPVLVLGMDVLGTVDMLVIDYKMKLLQMRLRHS